MMNKKKISKGFSPYNKKKDAAPTNKNIAKTGIPKIRGTKPKPVAKEKAETTHLAKTGDAIRLNKFISNSGVCSRREADVLISSGAVTVNGKIVTELGTKINPTDVVLYNGEKLKAEKKVYVLLNKPKDFITTATDPQGRKTVMDLVKNAGNQRIFPVGRLDRNTTGLLLLTNDGELTKKLTHPKYGVRKLYHVELDRPLTKADMEKISEGIELEGERIIPDDLAYAGKEGNKTQIGIEIHSGQNRVVRRIFESLDYKVVRLDRVTFAGLTKKDLPRGHWRFLTEKEVSFLKMIR
jgi:23S rRNA pseudouridine2605 synthase